MILKEYDPGIRYARQIAIEGIGKTGQRKLNNSKVLIIGCGALGSMVAMELAGAGVGEITVIDYDKIDISNLQRQFFYSAYETGEKKVETLAVRMRDLNPETVVTTISGIMTKSRAEEIFGNFDFIIDATDNPESKKITGDVAYGKKKPCCIAGVRDFSGQVMTFLAEDPRFEDYFGSASAEGLLPCSLSGVIGPAAALCASIQAAECIKYLTGYGELLTHRLFYFDLSKNLFKTFQI